MLSAERQLCSAPPKNAENAETKPVEISLMATSRKVPRSGLQHVPSAQTALGYRSVGIGNLVQRHNRMHPGR